MTDSQQSSQQQQPNDSSDAEQQRRIIGDLFQGPSSMLVEGQTYYLLATYWWNSWKQWSGYVGYDRWRTFDHYGQRPKPGPIDNSILLDESEGDDVIRKGKTDNYDYIILIPSVWQKLHEWYGGGPPIARKAIRQTSYHTSIIVEIRKLKLKIIWSKKPKECIERWFSKADSVGYFIDTMANELKFDKTKTRVYDFHNAKKLKLLDKMDKHLDEVQILDGQFMLIEEQRKNGKWPNDKIYKCWVQTFTYVSRQPTSPGKTGLQNLGNTCFMNSALQCLSQSVPIVDYFLKGDFLQEINESNPLGMKGEMARQYNNLLRELWSASSSVSVPRDIKGVIGKYAPQFMGYAQHDSHELLAFLLDGLHEDLNRIKQKPYVEIKDSEGRTDEEAANDAWLGYKKRNDSIIVDLFQGQLKSRLKCPINGRVSNQYDPFMYLSVPIPVKTTRKIIVTYYPMDVNIPPTRYGFSVDKSASVWDLKIIMGKELKVPPQSLFIFDVFSSRFHREFKSHEDVNDIRENDVVAVYEVSSIDLDIPPNKRPKMSEDTTLKKKRIFVLSREEEYGHRTNIGLPFVVSVDLKITYRQLYKTLHTYLLTRNHIQPTPEGGQDVFKVAPINSSWSNYYGHVKSLNDNDQPLDLDDKESVACEFNHENRRKYYNDRIDERVVLDPSAAVINETGGKDQISLSECLRLFTTEEQLSANDAWYCTECKEFREAYKKFDIWSAPKLLVVHLKHSVQ